MCRSNERFQCVAIWDRPASINSWAKNCVRYVWFDSPLVLGNERTVMAKDTLNDGLFPFVGSFCSIKAIPYRDEIGSVWFGFS